MFDPKRGRWTQDSLAKGSPDLDKSQAYSRSQLKEATFPPGFAKQLGFHLFSYAGFLWKSGGTCDVGLLMGHGETKLRREIYW